MADLSFLKVKWFLFGFLSAIVSFFTFGFVLFYFLFSLSSIGHWGKSFFFSSSSMEGDDNLIKDLTQQLPVVAGAIEGVESLSTEIQEVHLRFGMGEVRVDYNIDSEVNWDCEGAGSKPTFTTSGARATLDFSSAFANCDISIPKKSLIFEGQGGQLEVVHIQAPVKIQFQVGDISLGLEPKLKYQMNLQVDTGRVDENLLELSGKDGIPVEVHLQNGNIEKVD